MQAAPRKSLHAVPDREAFVFRERHLSYNEFSSTSQPFRLAPPALVDALRRCRLPPGLGVWFGGRHGFDGIDCGMGGMSGCGHP